MGIPWSFKWAHQEVAEVISSLPLPAFDMPDQPVWAMETSEILTARSAYYMLAEDLPVMNWGRKIWHAAIQPHKSLVTWKILLNTIPTDEFLQRKGSNICSRCQLCRKSFESTNHLFVTCAVSLSAWNWVASMFKLSFDPSMPLVDLFGDYYIATLSVSSKLLWYILICNLFWSLWIEQNRLKHDGDEFKEVLFKQKLILALKESGSLAFVSTLNPQSIPIFDLLGLSPLRPTTPKVVHVLWQPPPIHWVNVNTDGSFCDQAHSGYSGIFRNRKTSFLGAFAACTHVSSAIDAEMLAVIEAVHIVWANQWHNLWLEVDSLLLLTYFNVPLSVLWLLRIAWRNCMHIARQMNLHISHIYREGNSVAS
ncbi:hypothetical protein ACLB2K_059931 [Fragaria x ananassa]